MTQSRFSLIVFLVLLQDCGIFNGCADANLPPHLRICALVMGKGDEPLSAKIVIDNEYATLKYHPDTQIVHHVFHKPIGGPEFRSVLNGGAALLKEHGACKWLSDDRNNSALSDEDTEWSKSDWFPRAAASGWKFWALVVPPDLAARMNLKEFVDTYFELGLRTMVFTEPEEAMEWLLEVSELPQQAAPELSQD